MSLRRTRRRTPGRLAALQNLESELGLDILAAPERGLGFARIGDHPIATDVELAPDGTSSFEAAWRHGQGSRRVSRLPSRGRDQQADREPDKGPDQGPCGQPVRSL